MNVHYDRFEVPVEGGTVACGRWGTGDRMVIASHGITANHLSWQRVAELLVERSTDSVSLVAIDHRGRAGSAATPGPFGMAAHADDLIAVLDHLGVATATFAGHSMGGFVVATAAENHPERVERLVLVDGGVPFPLDVPDGADLEAVVQSVIGPALDRLDQRWDSEDAYVDFFRAHPAFLPPNDWPESVEGYVRYDCTDMPHSGVGSSVQKDAVLVDGGAAIVDPHSASSIQRIDHRATFLWAPRGVLDEPPGLYPSVDVAAAAARLPHLTPIEVPDSNHYTVLMGQAGASLVADALLRP